MSDYWSTTYSAFPLRELQTIDASELLRWISDNLPVNGSKIDWDNVVGRHQGRHIEDDVALQTLAGAEVCARIQRGPAMHAGDGLSPTGVVVPVDNCTEVVESLLAIPEHHYFLAADHSWLVVVTTEGDLDTLDFE